MTTDKEYGVTLEWYANSSGKKFLIRLVDATGECDIYKETSQGIAAGGNIFHASKKWTIEQAKKWIEL